MPHIVARNIEDSILVISHELNAATISISKDETLRAISAVHIENEAVYLIGENGIKHLLSNAHPEDYINILEVEEIFVREMDIENPLDFSEYSVRVENKSDLLPDNGMKL